MCHLVFFVPEGNTRYPDYISTLTTTITTKEKDNTLLLKKSCKLKTTESKT
jgi:hypothetical protein